MPHQIHNHSAVATQTSGPLVTCPECGASFELSDALAAPIRTQLADENRSAYEAEREVIRKREAERARAELEANTKI